MSDQKTSYLQIFRTTSLFGGVQIFQILISIIRSKVLAVLLGPAGMGVNSILQSTTGFIAGITNFGLGTSAIRNIASASASGDAKRISITIKVVRRLVWLTGLLGAVMILILSPILSEAAFGNRDYTIAFIWISITLLLNQVSTGQSVILRGTRQFKFLARASLFGSLLGLITSIPIYYKFGINGIVPAIILSSLLSLTLTWAYSRKVRIDDVELPRKEFFYQARGMLIMGFMLSLSGFMTLGTGYILRLYISNISGIDQVGLFAAGFAIINTYIGMVFTAMSTDFYPRLSGVASDNAKSTELINQQSEISVLILSPMLVIFLVFINHILILFYSTKFLQVSNMIQWAALGIYFKAASWPIGYILIAKGASKVFLWGELGANCYILVLNILAYKIWGLDGLGISFLASFILGLAQNYLIARHFYSFSFKKEFIWIFCTHLILGIASFLTIKLISLPWSYIGGVLLISISTFISYKELDKRIELKESIITYFRNKHGIE